jgi:hypothetical protein
LEGRRGEEEEEGRERGIVSNGLIPYRPFIDPPVFWALILYGISSGIFHLALTVKFG